MKPLINENGITHEMTDEQYAEYLRMQEEFANMPKPPLSPEQRLAALEEQLEHIRTAVSNGMR